MIRVNVVMHGIFREYGIEKEYKIELEEGSTFEILMQKLTDRLSQRFRLEVYEEMETNKCLHNLIFLNNRNLFVAGGMKKVLEDGDCISFVPPMAGG